MTEAVKELTTLSRKFMFDERHDEEEARQEAERLAKEAAAKEAEAQQVAISREELVKSYTDGYDKGRHDSYEEGYLKGFEDGQSQAIEAARAHADTLAAAALHAIAQRMGLAQEISTQGIENLQKVAITVATTVGHKLAEKALEDMPDAAINAMITEVLGDLDSEKKLILRLNPATIDIIKPKLETLAQAAGFSGTIEIRGESSLAPYDGRLTWIEGGAQRVLTHLSEQIDAVITRHYHTDTLSDEDIEITGVGAPEGHEDIAMPPAPEFIFSGEPALASAPLSPMAPTDVPLPPHLEEAPPEAEGVQADPDNGADAATMDGQDAVDPEKPLEQVEFGHAPGSGESVGFMQTGKFEIGDFSENMEPSKKKEFQNIGMDQFEQLDDA